MNIQAIIATSGAALAVLMTIPMYAHDSERQAVTKNFSRRQFLTSLASR
jgi:hypothetical protein